MILQGLKILDYDHFVCQAGNLTCLKAPTAGVANPGDSNALRMCLRALSDQSSKIVVYIRVIHISKLSHVLYMQPVNYLGCLAVWVAPTVPVIASRVGPPLFPYVDAGQCAPGFYRSRGDQEGTYGYVHGKDHYDHPRFALSRRTMHQFHRHL